MARIPISGLTRPSASRLHLGTITSFSRRASGQRWVTSILLSSPITAAWFRNTTTPSVASSTTGSTGREGVDSTEGPPIWRSISASIQQHTAGTRCGAGSVFGWAASASSRLPGAGAMDGVGRGRLRRARTPLRSPRRISRTCTKRSEPMPRRPTDWPEGSRDRALAAVRFDRSCEGWESQHPVEVGVTGLDCHPEHQRVDRAEADSEPLRGHLGGLEIGDTRLGDRGWSAPLHRARVMVASISSDRSECAGSVHETASCGVTAVGVYFRT